MFWRRHKPVASQLSAYIDGEPAGGGERDRLEAHLAACPACRRRLGELRATVGALQALPLEEAPRSFALSPATAPPRHVGDLAGLALPLRLASAGLAFALAIVFVVDLADVGGDGRTAQAPAPAAERAAPAADRQTDEASGLAGERQQEGESPTIPSPRAAEGEAAAAPETVPSDGGGLDRLRASEIALAAALGVLLLGWGGLSLLARKPARSRGDL